MQRDANSKKLVDDVQVADTKCKILGCNKNDGYFNQHTFRSSFFTCNFYVSKEVQILAGI